MIISQSTLTKVLLALIAITTFFVSLYLINISKSEKEPKFSMRSSFSADVKCSTANDSNNVLINRKYQISEFYDTKYDNELIFKKDELKHLLMWTHNHTYPFIFLKNGQEAFINEKCEFTNCYVTNNRQYLPDLTDWDAILFHGPEFTWNGNPWDHGRPDKRSPHQRYIYTCIESSDNYPSCFAKSNNYFNWTWTYKVDSDVRWGYMGIREKQSKKIIGPTTDMHWEAHMRDISEEMREQLKSKTKAAAWFVSNCRTHSHRESFAKKLAISLKKYNLEIDIYGDCGTLSCSKDSNDCWEQVKKDYFFYLAFENSFSEDYVTEKFVNPMKHNTVPIVWGGSNYSRFAPPNSYIDAKKINDSDEVAKQMHFLMNNFDEYIKYFKWTNYYSYQRDIETPETHAFCLMCKALNDPTMMKRRKVYKDFNKWWNGGDHC